MLSFLFRHHVNIPSTSGVTASEFLIQFERPILPTIAFQRSDVGACKIFQSGSDIETQSACANRCAQRFILRLGNPFLKSTYTRVVT